MAKAIMFLGTGSDVGKSVTAAAFCRILARRGVKVAPFKAQNMSNNSYVTVEGGEIGRAQVVQAEASGILPSIHMNPILLKPSSTTASQIVLQGKVFGQMDAVTYDKYKPKLKQVVMDSYARLNSEYDVIVLEGAGSSSEMNLRKNDLVNFPMALEVGARCVLVADIDRGGVFAQIIGSCALMTSREKDITGGFIINKFRGDPKLFDSGMHIIEKKTARPVFGLVPFFNDIRIDSEDSVVIQEDRVKKIQTYKRTVNIAVLKLPGISNFTDTEILMRESDVALNFLTHPNELTNDYDLLVIPGTKNTMEDARWLEERKWTRRISEFNAFGKYCLGICGGYQLLGLSIRDPHHVESRRSRATGLGLLPLETVIEDKKVIQRVEGTCLLNGRKVQGYEIHMGRSTVMDESVVPFLKIGKIGGEGTWKEGAATFDGRVSGTYVHGILDEPDFRNEYLNRIRREKGLKEMRSKAGRPDRFHQYDRIADHYEKYCDVDAILKLL